jgi:hypothetical protein
MSSSSVWFAITGLGSAGLMLPVAAVIAGQLIAARAWRIALWWSLYFSTAVGLVLASKIAFLGWGIGIRSLDFTGVSGHTTLTAAVLPVLAYLLSPRDRPGVSTLAMFCGVVLSAAVGVSRWVLGMHSAVEVLVGLWLGASVAAAIIWLAGQSGKPLVRAWPTAVLLILVAAFHYGYGDQVFGHGMVVKIALYVSGREQPFSRAEWHSADHHVQQSIEAPPVRSWTGTIGMPER